MKAKQSLWRAAGALFFTLTMSLVANNTFAQVKIGTNPTVIDLDNNLEIEASTPNRKTSVDKTSGQVTIKDGTEGQSKVFTSDANGGGSWQLVEAGSIAALPKGKMEGASTGNFTSGGIVAIAFTTSTFSIGGVVKSGNGLTVPQTGYYQINNKITVTNSVGCNGTSQGSTAIILTVNGVSSSTNFDDKQGALVPENYSVGMSALVHLNAGDIVGLQVFPTLSPLVGCDSKINSGEFSVHYVP